MLRHPSFSGFFNRICQFRTFSALHQTFGNSMARKIPIQHAGLYAASRQHTQTRQEGGRLLVKRNVLSRRYLRVLFAAIGLRTHP
jgi:hypothetical protein